jgi:hypothetical protein
MVTLEQRLIYIAGLMDGEGSVFMRKDGYLALKIAVTDKILNDFVMETLDMLGLSYSYCSYMPKNKNAKTTHQIYLSGLCARIFYRLLLPYLRRMILK